MLNRATQSEAETKQLAIDVALALRSGDLLLLSGGLGSGKTVMARAIIRQLVGDADLEVPSPTYTLCHEYASSLSVYHYDLYRMSGIEELDELGWQEQLEESCLIMEWPERCFDEIPQGAVHITIRSSDENSRSFELSGDVSFLDRIERSFAIRKFLNNAGKENASRQFLSGDASTRSYEFINSGKHLLMNAPAMPDGPPIKDGKPYSQIAHLAEDVSAFIGVDMALEKAGVRVPEIYASDLSQGLLLTEYFGSEGVIDQNRSPIAERYKVAIEVLAHMHEHRFENRIEVEPGKNHTIPPYDDGAKMIEVELMRDWYLKYEVENSIDEVLFARLWQSLFDIVNAGPQTLVLRDYHSPNLLWIARASGIDRVGVIDFQDAIIGPEAYDVASLAQDGRVDVSEELETQLLDHYIAKREASNPEFDREAFLTCYAIMAAQRATKLLGIFVRLDVRDGKPEYRAHLPRVRAYLKRCLKHPVMAEYCDWLFGVIDL